MQYVNVRYDEQSPQPFVLHSIEEVWFLVLNPVLMAQLPTPMREHLANSILSRIPASPKVAKPIHVPQVADGEALVIDMQAARARVYGT